jgi:hypothetical protein
LNLQVNLKLYTINIILTLVGDQELFVELRLQCGV